MVMYRLYRRSGEGKHLRAAGGSAGRVTLEDGQQAVGNQVALRGVAELQSLRGAAAPAAGPLLSLLRRRNIGSGTCPGGARTAPTAEVRGRGFERRVLDTVVALHRTAATRPGRQRSPKYRQGGPPRRGQVAAPSPPPEEEGRALPCPARAASGRAPDSLPPPRAPRRPLPPPSRDLPNGRCQPRHAGRRPRLLPRGSVRCPPRSEVGRRSAVRLGGMEVRDGEPEKGLVSALHRDRALQSALKHSWEKWKRCFSRYGTFQH